MQWALRANPRRYHMAISATLKLDIETYASRLRSSNRLFKRAQCGELTPGAIAGYVANLRFLVQHTDVNLKLARTRAEQLGRKKLAAFFEEKAHEEEGHDRWAEKDMVTLKTMFGVTSSAEPARSIRDLLDYLRAMITEEPTQYLAYILFVEYLTVLMGPEWLRMLEERCGIPASAMTVVGNHVALDKEHVAKGLQEIDLLVEDGQQVDGLRRALRTSMEYFEGFCDEISATIH
jgi:pyrroloquinoline quinone (PQQ) biosynthesis protein C